MTDCAGHPWAAAVRKAAPRSGERARPQKRTPAKAVVSAQPGLFRESEPRGSSVLGGSAPFRGSRSAGQEPFHAGSPAPWALRGSRSARIPWGWGRGERADSGENSDGVSVCGSAGVGVAGDRDRGAAWSSSCRVLRADLVRWGLQVPLPPTSPRIPLCLPWKILSGATNWLSLRKNAACCPAR